MARRTNNGLRLFRKVWTQESVPHATLPISRYPLKGCLMLTGLMGLAWIIGFFIFLPDIPGLVFQYLFTIFSASQVCDAIKHLFVIAVINGDLNVSGNLYFYQ